MTALTRYRAVVAEAGVARAFAASLIGRLSLGMTGLAILLLVRDSTGSYADAGAVSAGYALAFAAGAPARARSADRRGPVPVVLRCAAVNPIALISLAVLARHSAPTVGLLIPAVIAGASVPPLGAVMRALWAARLPASSLPAAYSLESVLVELCFVLGPGLVAALAAYSQPAVALVTSTAVSTVGAVGMAASTVLRAVRPEPDVAHGRAGPLTSPSVRALLLTVLWIGASFGAVEVAMPAFAEEVGSQPATAGVLLAIWSVGSMIGGLAYGASTSQRPPAMQMRWLVPAVTIGSALPLVAPGPITMAIALLLYGSTIAPFMACNAVLLGASAPRGTTTEAFAWNGSMIFGGAALGTALAGVLIDAGGSSAGLAVTAVSGVLTLLVSLSSRRRILAL